HKLSPLSLHLLLTPYPSDSNTTAEIENIDWLKKVREVIPDTSNALLSEDKIATEMRGFQAKKTPVIWMSALAKIVDEKLGIVLSSALSTDNETDK
ncbi:hypothetical protein, partial [Xenorhabdus bovienii]